MIETATLEQSAVIAPSLPGNVGIIVTARVRSSRIPEKVLAEIGGRKAIEILLSFVKRCKMPVVLAIPEAQDDNVLIHYAQKAEVEIYRGQDKSPLHRLAAVAKLKGWDHVVRITCDDILIDSYLTRKMVEMHLRTDADYTYCHSCPEGTVGEVIRAATLMRVADEMPGQDVEYVSYYLKKGNAKVYEYVPPKEFREQYRVTLDYPEDLTVLRIIMSWLNPPFGALDLTNVLKDPKRGWFLAGVNRQPGLTLYTCCFNQAKYVKACMKSVMEDQRVHDKFDFEYIVIDDASTDGSAEAMLEYYGTLSRSDQKRVTILRNEKNIGLPASCNRAIARARGRYLMRVDSDDMLCPGAAETMVTNMRTLRDIAALYAGYFITDENGVVTGKDANAACHPGCAMLLTRTAHEIRYKEGLENYEGVDFHRRLVESHKTAHIDEPLWFYRMHGDSKSHDPARAEQRAIDLHEAEGA